MAVLDDIREQIKVFLQGVTGIGVVHDYYRWATEERKLLSLLQDADGRINAVMFRRERMAKRKIVIGSDPLERVHVWAMCCVMGMKDQQETGILFDSLLSGIEEAFVADPTLGGTCLTINPEWGPMAGLAGVQIDLSEERIVGGILCHYAELHLCSVERNNR